MGGALSVDALRLQTTLHSASSVCACVCGRDSVCFYIFWVRISSASSVVLGRTVGCPLILPRRAVAVRQTTFLGYRTPGFEGLLYMLPLGPAWHLLDRIRWVLLLLSQRCSVSVTGASDWQQSSDLFIFSFVFLQELACLPQHGWPFFSDFLSLTCCKQV